ncbi:hypothetical protein FQN57_003891 [Myotisia sp. PD_48]|nr:hypothetical protein FQN57_003891 [Myotisia sp. PD_48]
MGQNREEDRGPALLAIMWSFTAFSFLVVVVRLYVRLILIRKTGADDWIIFVSTLLGLTYVSVTTKSIAVGYGRHQHTLSDEQMRETILLNSVAFIPGILSFTVPKIGIAAMLNRILLPTVFQRNMVWLLTGLMTIASCVCILILFTRCSPPQAMWDNRVIGATCRDPMVQVNYGIFTGAFSAFVDLYLAVYPITVCWKLRISFWKKVAVCAALGLGSIACAVAIVKSTHLKDLADMTDYTYGTTELVIWTSIESNVIIIASCIPTLKPLLDRFSNGKWNDGTSRKSHGYFFNSNSGSNGSHQNKPYAPSRVERWKRARKRNNLSISFGTTVESEEHILSPLPPAIISQRNPYQQPLEGIDTKLSDAYNSPDSISINLTQLLSRLESNLLSPSADLKSLVRSEYHRARVNANIEYAYTLLLQLDQALSNVKQPPRNKQLLQADLGQKRQQVNAFRRRLNELNTQARGVTLALTTETDADSSDEDILPTPQESATPDISSRASTSSKHYSDSGEGDHDQNLQIHTEKQSPSATSSINNQAPTQTSISPSPRPEQPFHESTLRSRHLLSTKSTLPTDPNTEHPTGDSTGRSPLGPSSNLPTLTKRRHTPLLPSDSKKSKLQETESALSAQRLEQDQITESLLSLATRLKESTQTFNTTLENEKSVLSRAAEGLDKNTTGLESASKKMGVLRRMSEGKGWWGRTLLYLWIFGMWIVAILLVALGPKLRF